MTIPVWIVQVFCFVVAVWFLGAAFRTQDGPDGCIPMVVFFGAALLLIFYAGHLWH